MEDETWFCAEFDWGTLFVEDAITVSGRRTCFDLECWRLTCKIKAIITTDTSKKREPTTMRTSFTVVRWKEAGTKNEQSLTVHLPLLQWSFQRFRVQSENRSRNTCSSVGRKNLERNPRQWNNTMESLVGLLVGSKSRTNRCYSNQYYIDKTDTDTHRDSFFHSIHLHKFLTFERNNSPNCTGCQGRTSVSHSHVLHDNVDKKQLKHRRVFVTRDVLYEWVMATTQIRTCLFNAKLVYYDKESIKFT